MTKGRSKLKSWFVAIGSHVMLSLIVTACTFGPRAARPKGADAALVQSLTDVVTHLGDTIKERNVYKQGSVEATLEFVTNTFARQGYSNVSIRSFPVDPVKFTFQGAIPATNAFNVVVEKRGTQKGEEVIVVGAHYDTMAFNEDWSGSDKKGFRPSLSGTPGANDNATGIAALLAISKMLKDEALERTIRFVAFGNEEPPFFLQKNYMGSSVYARECKEARDNIIVMLSLDALGIYTRRDANTKRSGFKGCLSRIVGLSRDSDYVAFMSHWQSFSWLQTLPWAWTFSKNSSVKVKAVSLPYVCLIGDSSAWSDDWSFVMQGYPAFCVTDTAMYRSDRYHENWDDPRWLTPDDYEVFARVVEGLAATIRAMANK